MEAHKGKFRQNESYGIIYTILVERGFGEALAEAPRSPEMSIRYPHPTHTLSKSISLYTARKMQRKYLRQFCTFYFELYLHLCFSNFCIYSWIKLTCNYSTTFIEFNPVRFRLMALSKVTFGSRMYFRYLTSSIKC